MNVVRVAVNGYGVIGKRVADAVQQQEDMELVGVADVVTDYRLKTAAVLGHNIYAAIPEVAREMDAAGVAVTGTLDELLGRVDVVVDCTPKKVAAGNKPRYEKAGVKAVFPGGRISFPDRPFLRRTGELRDRPRQDVHQSRILQHHLDRAHVGLTQEGRPAKARTGHPDPARVRPMGSAPRRHHEYRSSGKSDSEPPGPRRPHRHARS